MRGGSLHLVASYFTDFTASGLMLHLLDIRTGKHRSMDAKRYIHLGEGHRYNSVERKLGFTSSSRHEPRCGGIAPFLRR